MKAKTIFTLVSVSLAALMICVEYTGIVIVILPASKSLGLSLFQTQLMISLYLFLFVLAIIPAGRFGDIVGYKTILMMGIFVFTVGSLLGGTAHNAYQIMLGRALQGLGSALMWPNITTTAFRSVDKNRRFLVIGIITSIVGFSMAAAPFLAAYLCTVLSWRWFFLFNVPVGALIFLYAGFFIAIQQPKLPQRIDVMGLFVFFLMLITFLIGINFLKNERFFYFVGAIAVSFIMFRWFLFREKKTKHPLIDLSLFESRNFLFGCLARCLVSFSFYAVLFIMSLYLHRGLGYSVFASGVAFLPMTLAIGVLSPIVGRLNALIKPEWMTILGLFLFAVSGVFFMGLDAQTSKVILFLMFMLPGVAYSLLSPGLLTISISVQTVPENKTGLATGVFYTAGVLGNLLGVSFSGIILNYFEVRVTKGVLIHAMPPIMLMCSMCAMLALLVIFLLRLSSRKKFTAF